MRAADDRAIVSPSSRAAGRVVVPGDKSISHRYALLAALAEGDSTIRGFASGADCAATLTCLRALGVGVTTEADEIVVHGRGLRALKEPGAALDAANSGTTLRLLSGILAGQRFTSTLTGDRSLLRRPMRRIIEPLTRMGAAISSHNGCPPLVVSGGGLQGISHTPPVPSAQVKSCVLLAGLFAEGRTEVSERVPTRDHTERALETFNVRVDRSGTSVSVTPRQTLRARSLGVPGDISSAAFWCALAAGTPGGHVVIEGVGLNPSRRGFLEVLTRAGARVVVEDDWQSSAVRNQEPHGRLTVSFDGARSFDIAPEEVPGVIDEIPALAALAAMMPAGTLMTVRGAAELRFKESDRITSLAAGFRAMGSIVDEAEDGFTLQARALESAQVDSQGDHRLAMAFAIAATRARGRVEILRASSVDVSYPGFFETLERLTGP
jgi:3-phosphoshikimate 1-carboxyvinyltransferase